MKVTLIRPSGPEYYSAPNVGILYIAAVLEESGHSVQIIDLTLVNDDFIDDVVRFNPDIVGFSISTAEYHKTKNIIKRLKGKLPNALWTAGGIHPTVLPIETLEQLELDFVVIGEGEYALRDVCENLENGKGLRGISGIIYKGNGKIIEGPPREFITNLDELPFPARHLIDFERYLVPPGIIRGEFIERLATVITSRGCPFKCIFCSSHKIFGRRVRRRSVKNVMAEIDLLVSRYKVNGIWFLDDEFTLSKEWVFEFCEATRKKKYNLKWCCQTRISSVTKELLKAMKAAGCVQIDYGVESGSEKVLKKLKKGITPKQVEEAFAMTKEVGLRAMASFMIGNPGEEKEDIDKTFELAKKISPDYVQFFYTIPYPGSELYEMAKENKWLIGDLDFTERWQVKIDNPQSFDPVMEINFSKEELHAIRTRLQNHFLINNYMLRLTNYKFLFGLLTTMVKNPRKSIKWTKHVLLTKRVDEVSSQILNEYRRAYYNKRKHVS